MRAIRELTESLRALVRDMGLDWPEKTVIEPPKDSKHGDLAANIAMLLAKPSGMKSRDLAERIARDLPTRSSAIANVEVAGPGFLNVRFTPEFWRETILNIEAQGKRFGSSKIGNGRKTQIEYVSANPTGPLHIGHGRGAAVGDSLVRILRFAGYDVSTEYYLNDAGRQMRLLGLSVWLRARELSGLPVELPEDFYHGDYIYDIARELLLLQPDLPQMAEKEAKNACFMYAMQDILRGIKLDLAKFRVEHQVWFSEQSLVDRGMVDATFKRLEETGLAYTKDNAFWFKTTLLGDDKDRVLRKSDGSLTYFATDIAYHADKYQRGFDFVVDIWGADHHGYIPRMRAAVAALGRAPEAFDVVLIQLVNLLANGEKISMSTRAGQFETLAEVIREVGVDAARFMFLSRKSDSPLDFDLELVKQRTMDNPVYYVQYAHARVCAVLRRATERGICPAEKSLPALLAFLNEPEEQALIQKLEQFCDIAETAATTLAPHHISHYLLDLAGQFHSYYARFSALNATSDDIMLARLALLRAIRQVIHNGLELLGVSAPENM